MRFGKLSGVVSAVTVTLLGSSASRADFSYNFDTTTGSASPGTPLVDPVVNGTAFGTVGQDSWVLASGVTSYIRNNPQAGFSGNWSAGAAVDPTTTTLDSIMTRAGANLGIGGNRYATFQFDGLVGPAGFNNTAGTPVYRRSELAPGVDANFDGDIRGTSTTTENAEVGPQFGYESTGTGFYLRRAGYSNTGTVTAASTASGVYTMQLVIDFNANPSTVVDTVHGGVINDGAGTLYVKQIYDAAGNPVNDVFRTVSDAAVNFNLGLSLMGGFGGADPTNWNGMSMRTAGNGGLDNILFTAGLPTTSSTWASNAGNWLTAGNWYIGVPNAIDAVANFTAGIRATSTIYADSGVTVGTMNFDNSAFAYNISGAGSLTLQKTTGSAAVNVTTGSHKINLPLTIASSTTINVASGATLRISDPVTVNAGKSITQTGAGTVLYESTINVLSGGSIALRGPQHAASLTLGGASSASLAAATGQTFSVVQVDAVAIASDAKIDFGTNELVTVGTTAQALARIQSGQYFSTATSASRGLGYGDAGGGNTRVLYTVKGDANLDRAVNFNDLVALAQNYNLASGAIWTQGDFTYDGAVNFNDLVLLAQNYNGALLAGELPAGVSPQFAGDWAVALSLVPEPTTIALLGLPLAIAARRRKA